METREKRRSAVPGIVRLVALSLFCGVLVAGCGNSAQSKFEDKLDELFDSLSEDLEAYAAGDTSEEKASTATWYEDGQLMMNPDTSLPVDRSMDIISTAKGIQDHFSYVSLEFLKQDPGLKIINVHGKGYKLVEKT